MRGSAVSARCVAVPAVYRRRDAGMESFIMNHRAYLLHTLMFVLMTHGPHHENPLHLAKERQHQQGGREKDKKLRAPNLYSTMKTPKC